MAPLNAVALGGEADCGGASVSRRTVSPLDMSSRDTDVDGDGRGDHDEIAIFEQPLLIPHDPSTALRAAQAR